MSTTNTQTFPFNSRDSYRAWRRDWKASYRETSGNIRNLKRTISQKFKDGEYAGYEQNELRRARYVANAMLEKLKAAKAEAQRQYEAERAEKKAA